MLVVASLTWIGLFVIGISLLDVSSASFIEPAVISTVNDSSSWELRLTKGVFKGHNLKIRHYIHPSNHYHSCYTALCEGNQCPNKGNNSWTFCYPAIIVTGVPKCGTSAMYNLLSNFPGAVTMHEKENCLHSRGLVSNQPTYTNALMTTFCF